MTQVPEAAPVRGTNGKIGATPGAATCLAQLHPIGAGLQLEGGNPIATRPFLPVTIAGLQAPAPSGDLLPPRAPPRGGFALLPRAHLRRHPIEH